MIIAEISGGFASQLQKYALGYGVAKAKSTELCLDLSNYMKGYFRPFVLNALNLPDCRLLNDNRCLLKAKIINNGNELIEAYENWDSKKDYFIHGEESNYDSFLDKYPEFRMSSMNSVYRYVNLKKTSEYVDSFILNNKNANSIGVHIRLGDFKTLGINESLNYYKSAIGFLLKKSPNSLVYFFSNDIESLKSEFGSNSKFIYINRNNGYLGDLEEFICFSSCKDKIITVGSTYSRYATQLGIQVYGSNKAITSRYLKQMEESTYLLADNDQKEGLEFFNSELFISEKECNPITKSVPEIRYDTIVLNQDLFQKKEREDFWRKYYQKNVNQEANILVIDDKIFNKWYYSDMFVKAITYARLGAQVIYIGSNTENGSKDIFRAMDMDGKDLGFDMVLLPQGLLYDKSIDKMIVDYFGNDDEPFLKIRKSKTRFIWSSAKAVFRKILYPKHVYPAEYNVFLPNKLSDLKEISDVIELYEKTVNEKN